MKQEVIEKYNAVTPESLEDYRKAREGGFNWMWFLQRARGKVMDSGYLPQQGALLFHPRYIETADRVLDGLMWSMQSVESPNKRSLAELPWRCQDIDQWRQLALSFSALMFDSGCIAALTWGIDPKFDPVCGNAPAAIFGDVGFLGIREKSLSFLRTVGGEAAANLAAEIGDCSCSHLYADANFVEYAFKESKDLRKGYFKGVCKAAYVAGATFAKLCQEAGNAHPATANS